MRPTRVLFRSGLAAALLATAGLASADNHTPIADSQATVDALARSGDTAALLQLGMQAQLGAAGTPAQEASLQRLALAMAAAPASVEGRRWLSALTHWQPITLDWLEEGNHRIAVPRHDVATAARYALAQWSTREAKRAVEAALSHSPAALPAAGAARAQLASVLAESPDAVLLSQRDALLGALADVADRDTTRAAALVAARLKDTELFEAVLINGDALPALNALRALPDTLNATDAAALARKAASRAELASAAIFQIARRARHVAGSDDWLLKQLDSPALGASAAAAIAATGDASLTAALGRWTAKQTTPAALRRGVTALRLTGTDASIQEIDRLTQLAKGSAMLRDALAETAR